jgi:hypothetical protein
MQTHKESIRKVEEAFKAVHGREKEAKAGAAWVNDVMREIRRIGVQLSLRHSDPEGYGRLVWRFSAATCLLALALTVYAMTSDLSTASEVTRLFLDDPLAVDMVHFLGIV